MSGLSIHQGRDESGFFFFQIKIKVHITKNILTVLDVKQNHPLNHEVSPLWQKQMFLSYSVTAVESLLTEQRRIQLPLLHWQKSQRPKSRSLCRHNQKYLHGSIPEELNKKIWLNVIGWAGTSCLLCTENVDFLTVVNNLIALGWVSVSLLRNVKHVDLWTYSSHIYH